MHLKEHLTIEVEEEDEKREDSIYRAGVEVRASQKYYADKKFFHKHFEGLHEAIIAEAEKKYAKKLFDLPELSEEKRWIMSEEAKVIKKKIAERNKVPEDEIAWVSRPKEEEVEEVVFIPYYSQRKVLNYICAEIQKQFPERYKNVDEVYEIFLKAHFTGRLLPLARIIEKTFGEGSFRLLGNMGIERESGILHLEAFKKARARQLKMKK